MKIVIFIGSLGTRFSKQVQYVSKQMIELRERQNTNMSNGLYTI